MRVIPSLVLLAACGGPPPTFAEVQADVLTPSCAFSSCHGGGSGYLELDGTAADHGRLVDVAAFGDPSKVYVVPGDPESSYLIQKLEGAEGIVGEPMPPPEGGLDPERIAQLRDWIDAGALP